MPAITVRCRFPFETPIILSAQADPYPPLTWRTPHGDEVIISFDVPTEEVNATLKSLPGDPSSKYMNARITTLLVEATILNIPDEEIDPLHGRAVGIATFVRGEHTYQNAEVVSKRILAAIDVAVSQIVSLIRNEMGQHWLELPEVSSIPPR